MLASWKLTKLLCASTWKVSNRDLGFQVSSLLLLGWVQADLACQPIGVGTITLLVQNRRVNLTGENENKRKFFASW